MEIEKNNNIIPKPSQSQTNDDGKKSSKYTHDFFDRVFKRILTLSSPTIVRFINGIFDKNYPVDSTITYNWTENVDNNLRKTIADTILTVNDSDSFHMEAQMYHDDDSIILRMFDYGYKYALRRAEDYYDDNGNRCGIILTFPAQVVIYLDSSRNIPDEYIIKLVFGKGEEYIHRVSAIKFQEESLGKIISKNMIILLPFKLLKVKGEFQRAYDKYVKHIQETPDSYIVQEKDYEELKQIISELREVYENDIIKTIEESFRNGSINRSDMNLLLKLTVMIFDYLYSRYSSIKEVDEMLHDESLDLEIDHIIDSYEDKLAEKDGVIAEKEEELVKLRAEFEAYKAAHS